MPLLWQNIPQALIEQISDGSGLCVAEEHVRQGGLASDLLLLLAEHGIAVRSFEHLHASARRTDRYGSQAYLRKQSRLDVETMLSTVIGKKAQPIA